jgi:hypothetical protein
MHTLACLLDAIVIPTTNQRYMYMYISSLSGPVLSIQYCPALSLEGRDINQNIGTSLQYHNATVFVKFHNPDSYYNKFNKNNHIVHKLYRLLQN